MSRVSAGSLFALDLGRWTFVDDDCVSVRRVPKRASRHLGRPDSPAFPGLLKVPATGSPWLPGTGGPTDLPPLRGATPGPKSLLTGLPQQSMCPVSLQVESIVPLHISFATVLSLSNWIGVRLSH